MPNPHVSHAGYAIELFPFAGLPPEIVAVLVQAACVRIVLVRSSVWLSSSSYLHQRIIVIQNLAVPCRSSGYEQATEGLRLRAAGIAMDLASVHAP